MKLSGNKILITGGASGIGFGLAERFAKEGNTVIICGRRENVLKEAAAKITGLQFKVCDIQNENSRVELFQWIKEHHSDTNVLVNNAGVQNWMKPSDDDFFQRAQEEIAINISAPIHLNSLFLKLPGLNTIMNVTSGLSFVPMVKAPVYSATKAFFHSYTLSMQKLLKENNIEVIECIPPALNTDLGGKGLHDHAPPVSEFIETIFSQLKEGKTTLTFGMSAGMSSAGPEDLKKIFDRMNG